MLRPPIHKVILLHLARMLPLLGLKAIVLRPPIPQAHLKLTIRQLHQIRKVELLHQAPMFPELRVKATVSSP